MPSLGRTPVLHPGLQSGTSSVHKFKLFGAGWISAMLPTLICASNICFGACLQPRGKWHKFCLRGCSCLSGDHRMHRGPYQQGHWGHEQCTHLLLSSLPLASVCLTFFGRFVNPLSHLAMVYQQCALAAKKTWYSQQGTSSFPSVQHL